MNFLNLTKLFGFLLILTVCFACSDDEDTGSGATTTEEPRARFTAVQSADDAFTFDFVNESINSETYAWDFGDGVGTSNEESPSYTYSTEGSFTVELTATGAAGTNVSVRDVNVTDPNAQLRIITGAETKTWKLLRDISAGDQFPILVGPQDRSQIWWALGLSDPIGSRPCIMEEEYIFGADGSYTYNTFGSVFADFGIWADDLAGACVDETVASNMVNIDGADISAWGSNTYTFDFDNTNNTLTVNGLGAHVGLPKVGTGAEFTSPQTSVVYDIVSLEDNNGVDMMVLETTLDAAGGYWSFTLVSYDDPSLEPELPGAAPQVGFESSIDGNTVTFTNTSNNADSFSWDFGDGVGTSTEDSPVYTYAADGAYTVVLSATNADGTSTASTEIIITSQSFSANALHGGSAKTWRLNPGSGALSVGPGKGSGEWFATNEDDINVRACAFNDEFTFDNAGAFGYNANGDIWGEAYMGITPDGCVDESALMGGAEVWTSANHAFVVTEADGDAPAFLTVTGTGAFIALPKAFNGGEHQDASTVVADGSVTYEVLSYVNGADGEILRLTVDISEGQVGGAWWTFTLITE